MYRKSSLNILTNIILLIHSSCIEEKRRRKQSAFNIEFFETDLGPLPEHYNWCQILLELGGKG